ncbi:alpha-ketoglutarate-dependent dioxygenase AlkB [uncultured Marixanthomonas sp.]|uniref:alpha-ketoglutarate-dependent dioxygenase AlkB family protein n=1 Tax=uncultured Marixanthomonas sp. TaxID=757245 RepID=UPI0030D907DC|tara:strand:+ start:1334 stop:1954 length:621 start_codon:yes stop_codon:yes gene_type:complete
MTPLFPSEENSTPIQPNLPNAEVVYYPHFFSEKKAYTYFETLLKETNWQQDDITVFGKTYKQPRLTALYGENGKSYSYSGITMTPLPLTPVLTKIKNKVEEISNVKFNVVLLNLYRDGKDSNGWHSDDEKELGENPVIASVSFGAERIFHLKHKQDKASKYKVNLKNGSLLVMKGQTQHFWKHQIPKTKKSVSPRINLTFRKIMSS